MPGTRRTKVMLRYLPVLLLLLTLGAGAWSGYSSHRDVRNIERFEHNLCEQVNIGRKNTRVRNAVIKEIGSDLAASLVSAVKAMRASAVNEPNETLRQSDLRAAREFQAVVDRVNAALAKLRNSRAVDCGSP